MAYNHLTEVERYHIQWYLANDFSLRKIAIALERNVSTISREIARCKAAGFVCYFADYKNKIEKVSKREAYKLKGKLLKTVKFLLKKKFSPEQISGRLWVKKGIKISHTAIYNWIYHKAEDKEIYKKELRFVSRNRQKNKRGKVHIPFRVGIEQREDKAKLTQQIGNLECDTILGKGNKSAVLTMVDMLSKFVFVCQVNGIKAKSTEEAVIDCLKGVKNHIRTLTMDNGREFCNHLVFGKVLGAKTYFTNPHSPWEKGLIENTNLLIRQYFPKGTDFNLISDDELKSVQDELNNRPRKSLGWQTPKEVFFKHLKCCT
ncbi:MAG: IS30 family transposase [Neisseriaceae bacterium]|nr:IS30 family transposase [Neisseriaceae bacterium]